MDKMTFVIICIISLIGACWVHDDTYTLEQAIEINKVYQEGNTTYPLSH